MFDGEIMKKKFPEKNFGCSQFFSKTESKTVLDRIQNRVKDKAIR